MKQNTVLVLLAIVGGLWYVSKQPGAAKAGTKPPQGTKAHQDPAGVYIPPNPDMVLMEHPTQGRAWIPNAAVAAFLPPYGEWKVV